MLFILESSLGYILMIISVKMRIDTEGVGRRVVYDLMKIKKRLSLHLEITSLNILTTSSCLETDGFFIENEIGFIQFQMFNILH